MIFQLNRSLEKIVLFTSKYILIGYLEKLRLTGCRFPPKIVVTPEECMRQIAKSNSCNSFTPLFIFIVLIFPYFPFFFTEIYIFPVPKMQNNYEYTNFSVTTKRRFHMDSEIMK